MTTPPTPVSRLYRKFENLDVSKYYGPPRPGTGKALLLHNCSPNICDKEWLITWKSCCTLFIALSYFPFMREIVAEERENWKTWIAKAAWFSTWKLYRARAVFISLGVHYNNLLIRVRYYVIWTTAEQGQRNFYSLSKVNVKCFPVLN
jgi:hypothetical protein